MSGELDVDRVDELFAAFVEAGHAPGVAYGVVAGGELVHAGGAGTTRVDGGRVPDERSTFRIASLTKSFTAAAVLALRDEGALRLDDPVAEHVPALAAVRPATADSPALTVRHLLTMSGGLPTDDPWADRQESMDDAALTALLRAGLRWSAAPGTEFAYSNLGFALLGRVVTSAAGREYRDEVRARLLQPLGLHDTAYAAGDVDADRLTRGHRRGPDGWVPVPFDSPGIFSAIGGLFSTVADLARWVGGLAAASPPRDDADAPDDAHPLRRASRREMQQLHRVVPAPPVPAAPGSATGRPTGYGFGLFVEEHPTAGAIASHPGGYPGYGAHVRWSTELGIGVVALANGTYAPASAPASAALDALLEGRTRPRPAPWPETVQARADVEALVRRWDDALADRLFAVNVDLDVPREERRAQVRAAADAVGLGPGPSAAPPQVVSATPAAAAWDVPGERGHLHVAISLTPQVPPRVQTLLVTAVPAPPGPQ